MDGGQATGTRRIDIEARSLEIEEVVDSAVAKGSLGAWDPVCANSLACVDFPVVVAGLAIVSPNP